MTGLLITGVSAIGLIVVGIVLLVRDRLAWGLITLIPGSLALLCVALLSVVYLPLPGAKSSGISTEEIRSQTTASTDPVRAALGSPRDLERNILDVASPFVTSVRVESLTGLATSEKDAFILRIIVGPDWEKAPDELKRKLASLWYDLFENWAGQSDVIVVVQNASGEKVADVGHSGVQIFK